MRIRLARLNSPVHNGGPREQFILIANLEGGQLSLQTSAPDEAWRKTSAPSNLGAPFPKVAPLQAVRREPSASQMD